MNAASPPPPEHRRAGASGWTRRDLVLLVPLALGGAAAAAGRTRSALALATVGVLVLVLRVAFGDLVPRSIERIAERARRIFTWIAVTAFWIVVVLPAWGMRTVRRTDRRTAPSDQSLWVRTGSPAASTRTFASPLVGPRPRSRVLSAIGLVVVLFAADIGVGLVWQGFTRSEVTRPLASRLGVALDGTASDPRADTVAMRGQPWAQGHLRTLQHMPQAYWPYTLSRPLPMRSKTINITGWARRSYEPAAVRAGEDLPVVALFGGSTTFGEGQRDEHTIASELARLAEAAGTPIRVINYGQRSWTAWQEALLFDQLSSRPDPNRPDLVVFYDGGNEVLQQRQDTTAGWPTYFNVDRVARLQTGRPAGQSSGSLRTYSLGAELVDWYESHSMALRVVRTLRGDDVPPPNPYYDTKRTPTRIGVQAAQVYVRARAYAEATADRRGIDATMFWQPVRAWRDDEAFMAATERIGGDTVVISDVLDDEQETYLDLIHTNELGARIVAERMWETLGPKVRDASS